MKLYTNILSVISILSILLLPSLVVAEPGHDKDHHHDKVSAVGKPAMAADATKTIHVTTEDTMRYNFDSDLNLKNGEIVTFVITNK